VLEVHEPGDAGGRHRVEQRLGATEVHVLVLGRLVLRLAGLDQRGEVRHRHRPMPLECAVQGSPVADVAAHQRPPAHGPLVPRAQIVVADGLVTLTGECLADVASDVAGPAGHQHDAAHGSGRRRAQEFPEVRDGALEPLVETHRRVPADLLARQRDVRLPLRRIVGGSGRYTISEPEP
jgi:hypothetical protein